MTPALSEPEELVALGAFVGAQVLVVCLSAIRASAYRERALLLHGAATLMAVLTVQSLSGSSPFFPEAAFLLVLSLAGFQLRDLTMHVAVNRQPRRWLLAATLTLPALAAGAVFFRWILLPGVAVWSGVVLVILLRAWPQSRPWGWWLLPGVAALVGTGAVMSTRRVTEPDNVVLWVAALLTLWSATTYVATGWRGRISGETRARIDARSTTDPLTGLATPLVFGERVRAARTRMQRYGHPSVLMLLHVENLRRLAEEFGPEVGESAVLSAANRIRQALREGDVAARVAHSRIAILVEGVPLAEAAGDVASRILVAGLKDPLPAAPAEFLHFRIVMAAVPQADVPAKALLARMGVRLDQELHDASQRRIATLTAEELGT
jgi:diguanylate cyclase (GGDEF)-like protein